MRKIALVLSIIILVMTGCQMTPQEKVVMSKRDEAFEKMVLVEAENNDYDFPEHYKDSFKGKDRSIDIKIDANVIVPDVSTFPVVKVKPIPISEEKVRLGADVLFEGRGGYYPSFIRTKSQIEDRILRLKAQIADEDALLESYDGNEEWAKMSIANNKKIIKDLKEEIKSAPEEVGHNPTNFTFQTHEFYTKEGQEKKKAVVSLNTPTPCPSPDATMDDRQSMYLIAEDVLSDEMFSRFRVSNEYGFSEINLRGEQRYELHFYKCYSHMGTRNLFDYDLFHSNFGDGDIGAGFKELKLTQNEARALAENTLDDMNIQGYYLESFKKDKAIETYIECMKSSSEEREKRPDCFYRFVYRPMVQGIPILRAGMCCSDEQEYAPKLLYERVVVLVANEGVVEFSWINPMDRSEVVNRNVQLISFDKVMKQAKKYMQVSYNVMSFSGIDKESPEWQKLIDECENGYIQINNIRLGMARVPVYNNVGEYIMIPVWNFYGAKEVKYKDEDYWYNDETRDQANELLLTINAIDGSIVCQNYYEE